ncbi:MAG: tyrosine-type recombinase/integrase [Planctomycetota bacterium]|nr:tyrosine-type recombinase/integrase [Planctomycetota bacterium]
MATIILEGQNKDRRRIQFIAPDKTRRGISLGKCTAAEAKEINVHVEELVECWKHDRQVQARTVRWASELLDNSARHWLYDRMAAVGLVTERDSPEPVVEVEPEVVRLGVFLDTYVKSRTDVKEGTLYNLELAARALVDHFGKSKPLGDITPGDADDWRRWLLSAEKGCPDLGDNTARRFCGRAKQFFRAAVRKRLISENPFGDMRNCNVQANRERDYFVPREDIAKALEACHDVEWQLIIVLARYGGLRTPSETLLLTWADVDFDHSRITVHSPKTEHHEGKDSRIIPLFPELLPYLEAAFNEASDKNGKPPSGTDYVITSYRSGRANLRTQFERILKRAGVSKWPKPFQNCRASRATELAAEYPAHVAAYWLGHSTLVAQEHYWRVTEDDYARATAETAQKAVQKNVQSGTVCLASRGTEAVHKKQENPVKNGVFECVRLPGQDSNLE